MIKIKMDPHILVGIINTKLRNNYSSLDELCSDLDIDKITNQDIK